MDCQSKSLSPGHRGEQTPPQTNARAWTNKDRWISKLLRTFLHLSRPTNKCEQICQIKTQEISSNGALEPCVRTKPHRQTSHTQEIHPAVLNRQDPRFENQKAYSSMIEEYQEDKGRWQDGSEPTRHRPIRLGSQLDLSPSCRKDCVT
jgi:hypothetical protein